MVKPTLDDVVAQLSDLQLQFNLKMGAQPGAVFQQDPTLGTFPQSQLVRPHCLAKTSVVVVVANGGTQIINFDQDIYNPLGGMHDAAGDPSKFRAPVAGVYLVHAGVQFGGGIPANSLIQLQILATLTLPQPVQLTTTIGQGALVPVGLQVSGVYFLGQGETLQIVVGQTSGGAQNMTAAFGSLTQIF